MIEYFLIVSQTFWGYLLVGIFGLIWGSFFNVCIVRIPEDKEIVVKPSHCPKCKAKIPWYLNIPVLSFLWLKGRCQNCKKPISIEYPLVEIAACLMFLWLFSHFGLSWLFFGYTIFSSLLLIISVIDLHHKIIPDELSLPGIVVGFLSVFLLKEISWWESLLGIVAGGGSFFLVAYLYELFTKREGLGGGDIKLLGMIGAWLGYKCILAVVIISSALGSIVGILLLFQKKGDMKTAIPFGPFLAVGAFLYVLWGPQIQALFFPTFL